MSLEQTWAILRKQWKLILICFLVVGLGALVGSKLMTPLYQSSSVIQVAIQSINSQAYNDLLASDQLVQTEAQLAASDPVLQEVASHYPGLTPEQLASEVNVSVQTNTQLLQITVRDPSPNRAAALANDIAKTLISQQYQMMQQANQQAQQQFQQNLDATQKQMDDIRQQIDALQGQPGSQDKISQLQAQLTVLQQHYNQWQSALAQLELNQAEASNFLQIVQTARPSSAPVQPNVLLNTGAGFLAGLLLGVLLAIMLTKLDSRVRTPEALAQVCDWSVLATIWKERSSEHLLHPQGHRANAESYRILRTNIGFAGIDHPVKSVLVTSALPHEGKSLVASNLAIFMAKAGKTTLLIDADLRRPMVHQLFGLPAESLGLSNIVLTLGASMAEDEFAVEAAPSLLGSNSSLKRPATNPSLKPFVHAVNVPNLWVMPSGPLPPNPPELLDSRGMRRLLATIARSGFDTVILDAPPLLGLADASILMQQVDGTLVVIDLTQANVKGLKQLKALLTRAGTRVLGCVVNKQQPRRGDISAYAYYYSRDDEEDGQEITFRTNRKAPVQGAEISRRR